MLEVPLGSVMPTAEPAADPATVEPVPVEPLPVEPLPVEAVFPEAGYAGPQRLGPPRLVVAMGVWSIVVAGLSLFAGPVTAMVMVAIAATRVARTTMIAPPSTVVPAPAEVVDPDGFAAADRAAVIAGLSRVRPVTPAQQVQLDELLAESGRAVVNAGRPVDPAVVAAGVSGSGQLDAMGTAGAAGEGPPSYYALANGRLELTDGRAVFFPGDGQPAVRAVAYALPDRGGDSAPPRLSDDAVRSTMRNIARLNGGRPRAAQVRAALSVLRGAGQQVVVPTTDGSDPAAEVTAAATSDDGTLTVQSAHGGSTCELTVTPGGQVSASLMAAGATASAVRPGNPAAMGWVMLLAAAQFAVAAYLLVIGILTVRRSRGGRLLHWVFVGVKLPVAAGAVVAGVCLGQSAGGAGTAVWWAAPALVGMAYPVGLVFALCSRSVRDYYGSAGVTSGGTRSALW